MKIRVLYLLLLLIVILLLSSKEREDYKPNTGDEIVKLQYNCNDPDEGADSGGGSERSGYVGGDDGGAGGGDEDGKEVGSLVRKKRDKDDDVKDECKFVLGDDLSFICLGYYPRSISVRYRDRLIQPDEPYAIFMFDLNPTYFFVAHLKSELHGCYSIHYRNDTSFSCITLTGKDYNVTMIEAVMYCFKFNMILVDELLDSCLSKAGQHNTWPKNERSVMHYTTKNDLSRGDKIVAMDLYSRRLLLLSILVIFLAHCV